MIRSLLVLLAVQSALSQSVLERDFASFKTLCQSSASLRHLEQSTRWSPNERTRTWQELRDWVSTRDRNIRSPAALLSSFREGRDWPTRTFLLSASRSSQRRAVDGANPRAIVFGNGLLFGMVGHSDPSHRNANQRSEVIQYDEERNRFRFGILDFSVQPPTLTESTDCQSCHGRPPRPLWQSLFQWDRLTNVGRVFMDTGHPNPLYSQTESNQVEDWNSAVQLSAYLDHLSLRRTAQVMMRSPQYDRYQYATIAALMGCRDIPSFLDEQTRDSHASSLPQLIEDTRSVMQRQHRNDYDYFMTKFPEQLSQAEKMQGASPLSPVSEFTDVTILASLRYLFESRGVNFRNLSFQFSPGADTHGYGFASSGEVEGLGASELLCHVLPRSVEQDPRLLRLLSRPLVSGRLGPASTEECKWLRTLSRNAIRTAKPKRRGIPSSHR